MEEIRRYTKEEWLNEGKRRFGPDFMKWKFVCPMCGHAAKVEDFKAVGADSPDCAYVECIGRYTGQGSPKGFDKREENGNGCNWAAYGFFGIPRGGVMVDGHHIFDFASSEEGGAYEANH